MRMLTGGVLVAGAEQAFAHALLIRFPHDVFARQVLLPASAALLALGVGFLLWGIVSERRIS
jgi:hypothetical protein